MLASVRPYATAGVALVGASVMAVSPITVPPAQPEIRNVEATVALAATTSLAYVPINMIHALINAPGNFIFGVEQFAEAMRLSGSWNDSHPMNVWGWDDANPAHAWSLMNMFVPFPALSRPLGKHLNWWMAANLPMHEGCDFECPDLKGMLAKMFKVPMSEFYDEDGYTFPVVRNPVAEKENGGIPAPTWWSEKTVKLDRREASKSFWNYLISKPEKIHIPSAYEVITAFANLARALQVTGHLPKFFAVDQIETFFKLFVRKPKEIAEIPPVNPDDPAYTDPDTDADETQEPPAEGLMRVADTKAVTDDAVLAAQTFTLTVDTGTETPAVTDSAEAADIEKEEPVVTAPAQTPEPEEVAEEQDVTPEPAEQAEESKPEQQTSGRHRRNDDSDRGWSRSAERVGSSLSKVADAFKRSTGSGSGDDSSSESTSSSRAGSEAAA